MRYDVNVSTTEIESAKVQIESYRNEIDNHSYSVEEAYSKVSAKIQDAIAKYEESFKNLGIDIDEAEYIYSCNEVELDKQDAAAERAASAAGTTPVKCDRSVQTELRKLINNLQRQRGIVQQTISNLNSNLNNFDRLVSDLRKFYDSVKKELSNCLSMAQNAQKHIESAIRTLSFGDKSQGSLCITSINVLASYARQLDNIKASVLSDRNDIRYSLASFTQNLTDDVSALSRETVDRVTSEVSESMQIVSDAARALRETCRILSCYLSA